MEDISTDLCVNFASIDCRDDYYTVYNPCAFGYKDKCGRAFSLSDKALRLQSFMQKDYLQRVRQVQLEIEKEYLAKVALEDFNDDPPDDDSSYELQEQIEEEASIAFPGPYANYYD